MKNFPAYDAWYLTEAHKTDAELERTYPDARAYRVKKGSRLSHAGDIGFDYGDSPGSLPLLYFPGGKNGYYHPSDLEEVDLETVADEIGWDEDDLDEGKVVRRKAYNELCPGDSVVIDGGARELQSVDIGPGGGYVNLRFVDGTLRRFDIRGPHVATFEVSEAEVSEYKGTTPAAGPDPDEYEGEEAEAFEAGAAADKGEENPHDRGSSLYQAWDDGYASNRRHSR